MKILELNLRAFGPFKDVVLDLSAGSEGLHLIYGPNEAGKTCALRAMEQMFFGIPGNSSDNFTHPYPKLRIGAKLRGRDAEQLVFLRRKGTKRTLLAGDDQTPLDEALLRHFLDGVDRDLFVTMFGISHPRLQQGGKEIAQGGGSVGQSLFAAGTGIANLRAVRESLRSEADKLFAPRGTRRVINGHLAALKKAKSALRDAQLPSTRWVEHDKALRDATSRLGQAESELAELSRQKNRGERTRDALPLVGRRKAILDRSARLGDAPILPDNFAEIRRETDATLRSARKAEESFQQVIDQIDGEIKSIEVPQELLGQSNEIEGLYQRLGSHRKAQADRPGLKTQGEQLRREAEQILRELDPQLSLECAERLRVTSRQRVEIQNLGSRYEAFVGQLRQADDQIQQTQTELAQVEGSLGDLPAPRDPANLKHALRRVQAEGDLEKQLADARAERSRLEQQAAIDLEKLPLRSESLDQLERLAVPSVETIGDFEDRFEQSQRDLSLLRRDRQETEKQLAECQRDIEQLRLEGDVPSEAELLEARRIRDLGWDLVLEAWQQDGPDRDRLGEFLGQVDAGSDLATAYRQAVEKTDELADRLRREANRVARLAQLNAGRRKLDRQLTALAEEETQCQQRWRQKKDEWTECWRPADLQPWSPRKMRAWLEKQQELVAQAEAIRVATATVERWKDRVALGRRDLHRCLKELGETLAAEDETLTALVDRSQAVADAIDKANADRRQLSSDDARLRKTLAVAESAKRRAEQDVGEWKDQWATAIEPLGLGPDSMPAAANEVLNRVSELFDRLKQVDALSDRIEGMDRDADQFRTEVEGLIEHVAPDLSALPVEQQVQEIYARLQRAIRDEQHLKSRHHERQSRLKELEEARATVRQQTARLDAMCQEAGCEGHEGLSDAIRRSDEAKRLRNEAKRLDEELSRLAAGATIDEFVREVEAIDADELPNDLAKLQERTEELEEQRGQLREKKGREQKELELMDAGAAAADVAEEKEALLARLETDVRQYARLRLASAVLTEGIERYRRNSEDPVLRRASELFRELTLRSFESLRTDEDDQGENVLVGIRPGETEPVHLDGMSDGTSDQLYLALRLASLEKYLEGKEPVPFIVDDVLISFDDDRATAALKVLADFSRRTQIIFFTHHLHLLRLAEQHLEEGVVLFVKRLPEGD